MSTPLRLPRLSLPLSDRDYADLEAISNSTDALRELRDDLDPRSSRAAIALAVFEEGLRTVKERLTVGAYAEMGTDAEEQRLARADRTRRSRRGRDLEGD